MIMKTLKYIIGILMFAFVSCSEEEFVPNETLLGLGGDVQTSSEVDQWIYENLTKPYNIDVKYKWDQAELDKNKTLVPIKEELVVPVMKMIKKIWIDTYVELAGSSFICKLAPKRFVLVGSPSYNSGGTYTAGEAEGGRKITIYRLNWYNESGDKAEFLDLVQNIVKTVHHEFAHIMHQTIMYPTEYKSITPEGYLSAWNNTTDAEAIKLGFISPYARSTPNEDFVEMIARIAVYGPEWWEARVAQAAAMYADPTQNVGMTYNPAEVYRLKESYVINYLKDVWGINFYDQEGEKGLVGMVQDAISEIVYGKADN